MTRQPFFFAFFFTFP
ncbi:pheA operon leader peptide PheL [Shimwellia blattae]|nr:pheA operon leader peptide PheL [Shimwellia blattae]